MSITINHQTNDISATSGSLTIDGAAAGGGGGALEYISTATITSSTSTVDIALPSGYNVFQIKFNLYASAAAHLCMAYSEDSGSTFLVTDYIIFGYNQTFTSNTANTSADYSGWISSQRGMHNSGTIDIFNAAASSKTMFNSYSTTFNVSSPVSYIQKSSGLSNHQTARINTVQMRSTGAFVWNTGKFILYGMKEA